MTHTTESFETDGEQVKIVRLSERQQRALAKLPPSSTKRWVTSRKVIVVNAVREGLLSLSDACERYHLSTEEFRSWARLFDEHGVRGLRATRVQEYRQPSAGEAEA